MLMPNGTDYKFTNEMVLKWAVFQRFWRGMHVKYLKRIYILMFDVKLMH